MTKFRCVSLTFTLIFISLIAVAQEKGIVPQQILRQIVQGMPKGEKQEVRVLTAEFQPGERTVLHSHRYPVTVYVLEGEFTLEADGRAPQTVKAGHAMIMPTHVKMTGYNRSSSEPLRVVAFYVSDPDTPFLDPIH